MIFNIQTIIKVALSQESDLLTNKIMIKMNRKIFIQKKRVGAVKSAVPSYSLMSGSNDDSANTPVVDNPDVFDCLAKSANNKIIGS